MKKTIEVDVPEVCCSRCDSTLEGSLEGSKFKGHWFAKSPEPLAHGWVSVMSKTDTRWLCNLCIAEVTPVKKIARKALASPVALNFVRYGKMKIGEMPVEQWGDVLTISGPPVTREEMAKYRTDLAVAQQRTREALAPGPEVGPWMPVTLPTQAEVDYHKLELSTSRSVLEQWSEKYEVDG